MALEFKDASFQTEVMDSGELTLVDFWAQWCGPCLALGPTIEALSNEFEGKMKVGKLNVDENPETAMKFGIRNIPTILLLKNGEIVERLVGAQPKAAFVQAIEKHL
ncbi:MAG: thioredoxin [Bacteroidetes bacterium]|nr:thioredoxin [Bacteroidota bacterium]